MADVVKWFIENRVVVAGVILFAALALSSLSVKMRFWGAATAATTSVFASGFVLAIMLLTWLPQQVQESSSSASAGYEAPVVSTPAEPTTGMGSDALSPTDAMAGVGLAMVVVVVTVVLAIIAVLMLIVAMSLFGAQSTAVTMDRRAEKIADRRERQGRAGALREAVSAVKPPRGGRTPV